MSAQEQGSPKWEVHVAGPDDLIPAESRLHAMRMAHEINAQALALMEGNGDDSFYPTVWASVRTADPRPCRGVNSNICVGEGCYGEACRRPS